LGASNVNAQTIAILEAELNGIEPDDFGPAPFATSHCGDTCGDPRCHYQCDPVTCLEAAFEAQREAALDYWADDDYCDTCNGTCTL
jgi:hypothetical protein